MYKRIAHVDCVFRISFSMPRSESQLLHQLLQTHDTGYSGYMSDLDNLYSYTLRSMDDFKPCMLTPQIDELKIKIAQLINIVRAATTSKDEFNVEMQRYATIFKDYANELRLKSRKSKLIKTWFLTAVFDEQCTTVR